MTLVPTRIGGRQLVFMGSAWVLLVMAGHRLLFDYQMTQGNEGRPAARWPADSQITSADGASRLVMFVHPHCPCSRASIEAMARIMVRVQGRVAASILFVKPPGVSANWEQTDIWRSAASIPGVKIQCDEDGAEAARFGAETSGHVFLYDPNGRRLFSGGITAGRGHHGDNAGLDQCLALMIGDDTRYGDTPVFGCPLRNRTFGSDEGSDACRQPR